MKPLIQRLLPILVVIGTLLVVTANAQPVCATGYDDCHPHNPAQPTKHKSDDKRWIVPVAVIAVGAGVWCWYKCERSEPKAPTADPQPLNVAPTQAETFTVRPMQ